MPFAAPPREAQPARADRLSDTARGSRRGAFGERVAIPSWLENDFREDPRVRDGSPRKMR